MDLSFGETIRRVRLELNMTVDELAKEVGIASSYLHKIEGNLHIPAEETVIRELSVVLGIDFNELMCLAGRFGVEVERYLKTHPTLRTIVRWVVDRDLTPKELDRLDAHVRGFLIDQ